MLDAVFPIAVLLAVVNRALIDYLAAPIRQKFPDHDLWYLVYISLLTGGAIGWLAGVNLFGAIGSMPVTVGRILTALCIGGGANLLHDIAKRRNETPDDVTPETRYNITNAGLQVLRRTMDPDTGDYLEVRE
jgi:hypothetical protein